MGAIAWQGPPDSQPGRGRRHGDGGGGGDRKEEQAIWPARAWSRAADRDGTVPAAASMVAMVRRGACRRRRNGREQVSQGTWRGVPGMRGHGTAGQRLKGAG